MSGFSHIGIICKPDEPRVSEILSIMLPFLDDRSVSYSLDKSVTDAGYVDAPSIERPVLLETADLFIVIGGDGTFLGAARSIIVSDKPVLGVNAGRLGFLTDINPEDLTDELSKILAGDYLQEERILLQASILRNDQVMMSDLALNDVSLHMRETVRMIEFRTRINGQVVHTLRADGLIVATPTGSTAYSLSAGGPVVQPGLDVLSVAPICPHTLSSRPIIVAGDSHIEINLLSNCDVPAVVTFDGQNTLEIEPDDIISIRKLDQLLKVVHPKDHDYFHLLRNKLHWSEQP